MNCVYTNETVLGREHKKKMGPFTQAPRAGPGNTAVANQAMVTAVANECLVNNSNIF